MDSPTLEITVFRRALEGDVIALDYLVMLVATPAQRYAIKAAAESLLEAVADSGRVEPPWNSEEKT